MVQFECLLPPLRVLSSLSLCGIPLEIEAEAYLCEAESDGWTIIGEGPKRVPIRPPLCERIIVRHSVSGDHLGGASIKLFAGHASNVERKSADALVVGTTASDGLYFLGRPSGLSPWASHLGGHFSWVFDRNVLALSP